MVVILIPCFSHFWNFEKECVSSLTFTIIIVHLISRWSFSSGIPIKAATRFMFRSMRFVSAALSISNFPVRSNKSSFLRNNKTSRSVKVSFSILFVFSLLNAGTKVRRLTFTSKPSSNQFYWFCRMILLFTMLVIYNFQIDVLDLQRHIAMFLWRIALALIFCHFKRLYQLVTCLTGHDDLIDKS